MRSLAIGILYVPEPCGEKGLMDFGDKSHNVTMTDRMAQKRQHTSLKSRALLSNLHWLY